MSKYPPTNPDAALALLLEGNDRYLHKSPHLQEDAERRQVLRMGQHPFAVVLCCSDSRVPPEILFDKRLGDLFVIRNAGNVVDDVVLGSIEYAVEHLGTQLVVVLGHENCGAVTATVKNAPAQGHLGSIMSRIRPALEKVKGKEGDPIANTIDENIREMVAALMREPLFQELVEAEKLKVVGMRYNLVDGTVTDVIGGSPNADSH
jgi:carbonic anhydrase